MNKWNERKRIKGFTLMELMVCVVLISVIAAFGIPSYQKAILKGRERNTILHLRTIHGANEIFSARNGQYAPGVDLDLPRINIALSINIIDNDMTYVYDRIDDDTSSTTASWAGANPFTVQMTQMTALDMVLCCSAGTCPSLPDC